MKANKLRLTVKNNGPIFGSTLANAACVITAPLRSPCQTPVIIKDTPVKVHIIILSIKVPVIDIKPCSAGHCVFAAAAAIGALPRPDSFEKTPRAIPFLIAIATVAPRKPPAAACPVNALLNIKAKVCGIKL